MHAQALTGLQVVGDDLPAQLAPRATLPADLLEPEAVAAEQPCSEALLETDRELHPADAAHKGVTVSQIAHARLRSNVDREYLPWEARRERHHAGSALRCELAHEDRAAADRALEDAADAAAATHLRRRLHDDRLSHPGELSRLGEDRLAWIEHDLEDGHGGADDPVLHGVSSERFCPAESMRRTGVAATSTSRQMTMTGEPRRSANR
jgi:hypothetical protein